MSCCGEDPRQIALELVDDVADPLAHAFRSQHVQMAGQVNDAHLHGHESSAGERVRSSHGRHGERVGVEQHDPLNSDARSFSTLPAVYATRPPNE